MPIYTYLPDYEVEAYKTTGDEDIDKALSLIHETTGEWVFIVQTAKASSGFLWWKKEHALFTVYTPIQEMEWEVINFFPREGDTYSINTWVGRQVVLALLHGYLFGLEDTEERK